jgi:flagellin-like hook-associated protein FlgL
MFRVAQRTFYRQASTELMQMLYKQGVLNEQLSSGKKVNRPSDDPISSIPAQHSHRVINEVNQYMKSVDHTLSWLQQSESKMRTMNDILVQLKGSAEQLSTGTYTPEQRATLATEVRDALETLVTMANTNVSGAYIFSGTKSSVQAASNGLTIRGVAVADTSNVGVGQIYARGSYTGLMSRNITVTVGAGYNDDPDTTPMPVTISYVDDFGRTISFDSTISGSGSGNAIEAGDGVQVFASAQNYRAGDSFTVEVGRHQGNEEDVAVNLSWNNRMDYNYSMDQLFNAEGYSGGDWSNLFDLLAQWEDALLKDSTSQSYFESIPATTNNPGSTAEFNVSGDYTLLAARGVRMQIGGPFQFVSTGTTDATIAGRQYEFYLDQGAYSGVPQDGNPLTLHYRYDNAGAWVDGGTITIDSKNGNSPENAISLNDDANVKFYLAQGYYDSGLIPVWTDENNPLAGEDFEIYAGPVDPDATNVDMTYTYKDDAGVYRWTTISPLPGTDQAITLDITDGTDPTLTISAGGTVDDGDFFNLELTQYNKAQTMSQEILPKLDAAMNTLLRSISDAGSKLNRMAVRDGLLEDDLLRNVEMLQRTEDVDITKAITDLETLEILYQASLQSTASVSSITLANYL